MDFKHWLAGLVAMFINGAASAVVLVIADPLDFNIYEGREKLITVSILMGLMGAANFLKKSPLPEKWLASISISRE